jgi:23S rRNA (uracil1939-C5)-methyltransferase
VKKKKFPILEKVLITDVAAEGVALARVNDMVVFVPHVIPGDVVDVQINRKRSNFQEGFPILFYEYSKDRIQPFCTHFGACGGCKWQILPYDKQLFYKAKQVKDVFERIGKLSFPEINPIKASAHTEFYRNKLEFSFSNKRWLTNEDMEHRDSITDFNALGFHVTGKFDKIVDVTKCHLQTDPSNGIRDAVKVYATEHNLTFFDIREHSGFLRSLIIRTASSGEVMVILSFYHENKKDRIALLEHLKAAFPNITSLMYVINGKGNDTIADLDIICYHGKDYILEEMEGLKFIVGPKSFYQTNSQQTYELYKITRDFAELTGSEVVYDLYTGTGTIANFVASKASKVIGVEYVPEAIEDAKKNSSFNGITNTSFVAGDMKDVFTQLFIDTNGHPDVIILDPPRAGIHEDVVRAILYCKPSRIVYVSCNPATQARDLAMLADEYEIKEVQPVDMFPHTHHVENVVKLVRKMS